MIDNFSLAVSHGLMLLAAWLLLRRPDLDREDAGGRGARAAPGGWRRRARPEAGPETGAEVRDA
ncbi:MULTISPECIES: hypothetical protein [unclassified Sphingomonas]|jgi:hypothetical protein|uniref:hypothetical protein n=1 Tax=unclassified Sphingomonas TaxID=196159 RepID=UPI000830C4B6|nr:MULTISPECIES: hypothetical protein [unclassified Sphingomonas]